MSSAASTRLALTGFLKRMLLRSVPDMTQGCCGTYARDPWIFTRPPVPRSSPRTAARREDLPAPGHPYVTKAGRPLSWVMRC